MTLTPTWPPTWSGSNFKKSPTDRKLERRRDRLDEINYEDKQKAHVRRRDKVCRFPLCGCRKLRMRLEVSHVTHKGMGGNPLGDRSLPSIMVLLCVHRHQDGAVSRHKGTLKAQYLTASKFNGPVAWLIDTNAAGVTHRRGQHWKEVARESAPGVLEPLTPWQLGVLTMLATMTC